jgi:transposase
MPSSVTEQQLKGWKRAFHRQRFETESWKTVAHNREIELGEALNKIRDLERESVRLQEELVIARKVPPWVKPNKSNENRKPKPIGPKKGHLPYSRHRPTEIDRRIDVIAETCPKCQKQLREPARWYTHVQIDLSPTTPPITTEYRIGRSYCSQCRHEVSDSNSECIVAYSMYGARLHAQVAYWKFALGLTLGKIKMLLLRQFHLKISTGELSEILSRMARKFKSTYEQLKSNLKLEPYLHADETGWRESGEKRWLWSFSNDSISYYTIRSTRSRAVVRDVLGEKYNGILFSDFYGAYNEINCTKQKCWIHLLRDCKKLSERYPQNIEVLKFKNQVKRFYERAIRFKNRKVIYNLDISKGLKILKNVTTQFALKEYQNPRIKVLARRMYKFRDQLYTSIPLGLSPQNNPGELEIRPTVLMRKTSYCNRSQQGAEDQAILMSVIQTTTKKGLDFIELAMQRFANK